MKKSTFLLLLITYLFASKKLFSQTEAPFFGSQKFINGYEKAIGGEVLPYFSVYPKYAKEALLTRCTEGKKAIEWETSLIPVNSKDPYIYFTWIMAHSCGTSSGARNFDLYINDGYALTFTTQAKQYAPYITTAAKDSTCIVLEYKTKDGSNDIHGFAHLRVPASKYTTGKALKLKVVGQKQNSNDWFMTFKYSFKEKIDILPLPFLLESKGVQKQPIQLTVLHFGPPEKLSVSINEKTKEVFDIKNGFNVIEVSTDAVKEKTKIKIDANIGKLLQTTTDLFIQPVTYREINLVHHAHTDIGYSHIQEEVEKIHVKNIRDALKLIGKTKNYPENSRFVWNIESSWAVENFMRGATIKDQAEFLAAVKNKQILISATYANILTGLCTPEEMNWIAGYSKELREKHNLPINTAMMSDIPGMSWSMVDAMAKNGVRYFSNGPNYVESLPDKGDRIGNTLREQGDKAFWWKSVSGKDSILLWTAGKGYSSWHGFSQGAIAERGTEKIAGYINQLDSSGYPHEMVQWRYNIGADNGPTDSTVCDFVKMWNEKYASPKLIIANAADMFERFEKKHGKSIPTLSGDFTPYWEDGAYSTAKEEAEIRLLSEKLLGLEELAKQNNIIVDKNKWYNAKKNIVLFHEHTWGSWCSISDPDSEFSTHQWEYKKRFVDSASYFVNLIQNEINPHLKNLPTLPTGQAGGQAGKNVITVLNTLNWKRSGYVEMACPAGYKGNILSDDALNEIPVQHLPGNKITFIAKNVPAKGYKFYVLKNGRTGTAAPPESNINYGIDSITGAIKKLNTLNKEWVNVAEFNGLLQAIYVKGTDPKNAFFSSYKKMEWIENNLVVKKVRITCSMEGANEVVYEITQYAGLNHLKLSVIIDKKAIREKESVHIAFPFALDNAEVKVGSGDGFITTEKGQIPGANEDFFSVQRWIDVSDKQNGVTLCSPQGALFEVGELINEQHLNGDYKKWKTESNSSPALFLYALNNYWHTNYKADQEGEVQFDIYLKFHTTFDTQEATKFGYEMTQPLFGIGMK